MHHPDIILIGEINIDFTLKSNSSPSKMRLGGITHAARALWACGVNYSVAAVCPAYLEEQAENYFRHHGCSQFEVLGQVVGAPNIFLIGDVREIGDQGYENILGETKRVVYKSPNTNFKSSKNIIIFPGSYELEKILEHFHEDVKITIDAAYDLDEFEELEPVSRNIENIAISTSSELFHRYATRPLSELLNACADIGAKRLLLKESRGGSRLFHLETGAVDSIPAVLSATKNSVGVGDAYSAVFALFAQSDPLEAAWRGMQVATCYSYTTFPDDFRREVRRGLNVRVDELKILGGTVLPWHDRKELNIYLAAPDFSYISKPEIDAAVSSLEYHNFSVRRPIMENGEAPREITHAALLPYYDRDLSLIEECSLVFAIPLNRDPGTLVEVGIAIARNVPVITYDPRRENANTMVICGSKTYSDDIDICLSGVFEHLSRVRGSQ